MRLAVVSRAATFACAVWCVCAGVAPTDAAAQGASPPEPARLLRRVQGAAVLIRRSSPLVGSGLLAAGFTIGRGQIVTAVPVLDETAGLEFSTPGGGTLDVRGAVALDRKAGWAVLAGAPAGSDPLPRGPAAFADDDRCYVVGRTPDGEESVNPGTIVTARRSGQRRCVAEFSNALPVPGSPVLNANGEVSGIAGTWMPQALGPMHRPLDIDLSKPFGLGTPVIPLPPPAVGEGATPEPFDALRRRGILLEPVRAGDVSGGGFALGVDRSQVPKPVDERDVFDRSAVSSMHVFLTWMPTAKLEGDVVLRMFDEGNAAIAQTRPMPMKLQKGKRVFVSWTVAIPERSGLYRFDVSLGSAVCWRSYAAVTDPEPSLAPAGTDGPAPLSDERPSPRPDRVIRPPRKIVDVRPAYPASAQAAKVTGVVVVSATIDKAGEVTNARVITSILALDHPALDAVRRWRFTVTLVDGKPVPVTMTMTSSFSLRQP